MSGNLISRALVSVSDKSKLDVIIDFLSKHDVEILTTGGTYKYIKKINSKVKLTQISDLTGCDEILDGRVKTLHPKIHAGILADRQNIRHLKELKKIGAHPIDLVIVNLYPFEEVSSINKSDEFECINNIDIGGPTMVRAAAKNFKNVVILSDPSNYEQFVNEIQKTGQISIKTRKLFATKAFETTAYYESLISNWFNRDNPDYCISKSSIPLNKISNLRYGENPHQKAAYYKFGKSAFTKIHGKDLSFNNIYDLESAISVSTEFKKCSCVIVKHGNPCGVALDKLQHKAYEKAFRCDEISAFGGVVAFNNKLTEKTAALINKIFTEVVIAPDFSKKARILLSSKKNIILIKYKTSKLKENFHIKSTQNFILIQQRDKKSVSAKEIIIDNKEKLSKKIIDDMLFAFKVSKYVSSNAIVAAADQATIGIGVGQTSRIESAKQAIKKIKKNNENQKIVLASDGFFPFSDIVKLCAKNNINFIIQPGGSINDKKIKAEAKKLNVNIAFTNIRHFKH